MIVVFALQLLLAGLLAALAAWFGEGALRRVGLPTRWVWVVGLVLTALVPLTLASRNVVVVEPAPVGFAEQATPGVAEPAAVMTEWLPPVPLLSVPRSFESLALPLLFLWSVASLVAIWRLAAGHAWLRRRRASWRQARVRDADVSIAPDLGPAVVGVAPGSIVLPHWALEASPEVQQLMVEHERQHLRSRDPWLQFVADAAVALAPWHPALHWLRRRLRAAVELDCDARVLRALPNAASRYAELLIAVAGRSHGAAPEFIGAMSLAPGSSTLERRIAAMTRQSRRNPLAATALAGAGIALGIAACESSAIIAPAPESDVPILAIVEDAKRYESDSTPLMYGEIEVEEGVRGFTVLSVVLDSLRAEGKLPKDGPILALADVDGVLVRSSSDLGAIGVKPAEIESVEVLKGAAAAGIGAPEGLVYIRLRDSSARPFRVQGTEQPVELELRTRQQEVLTFERPFAVRRTQPGAGAEVRADSMRVLIRGEQVRAGAPASPLYIVDGVAITNPDVVRELDPREIDSVEVIKGSAATVKYGSRAANGVILVTTKRGGGG